MKTIGYLGPQGTFTELAVKGLFKEGSHLPFSTIPACMDAVANKEADLAVVPLENAIEGSVNLSMDYLIHKHTLPIIGEIVVPIEQHLLVAPSMADKWKGCTEIYSHPHAIAQCHDFLNKELPGSDLQYTNSTGAAAKKVLEESDRPIAAIANELAAQQYGLVIAQKNIHDYVNNHTKFVILKRPETSFHVSSSLKTGEKTTLMVTLPSDYSGALHQVLSAFAWRKLNLSKIESRPMKTGLGNYFFVIDVDQAMDEVLIPGVVQELEALGCGVRVLGSYPCFSLQNVEEGVKNPVPK
ncbi:prephenate dehydratase [Bacillus sp. FJAT-44742]|uniref:prephenate dehydratase n=1 Tax=Bacillus sp. FJAT-44742 TaxID=2014005 RepID=UPI000C23306A|nr:prephenate dehydratase [Bacillus sp. FJAT-44742]